MLSCNKEITRQNTPFHYSFLHFSNCKCIQTSTKLFNESAKLIINITIFHYLRLMIFNKHC